MRKLEIVAISVLLVLSSLPVEGEPCQFRNRPNGEKVAYLAKVGPDASDPCVSYLIYWLGVERYEPAAPVLVRFLDFAIEEESSMRGSRTLHPAREALVKIGKAALPSLLKVIESDDGSPSARSSAVEVWMRIYRYEAPDGVAALGQAVADTSDEKDKKRLLAALLRCA
jgi:hypothetical protein